MYNTLPQKELLEEFSAFLEEKMGLHFAKKRWGELEKKLLLIAGALNFEDPVACVQWLKKNNLDKNQLAVLAYHLTVGETYFFRDEAFFCSLEKTILPEIIKKHQKERTLRIWSAGCCSGEEPYSVAILLHQLIPDLRDWNITLLGTDINSEFLKKALRGAYKKWSFRTTTQATLQRYFRKDDDTYTLIPEIRRLVRFMPLNLVEDIYPDANTENMDLILCHNVLMYFSEKQIKKAVHQLTKSLADEGLLSVAPVEVPLIAEKNLGSLKIQGSVYHKKGFHKERPPLLHPKIKLPPIAHTKKKNPPIVKKIVQEEDVYKECSQLYRDKHYQKVISKLGTYLEKHNLAKHLKETHLLIQTYANIGELENGLEWCEKAINADKLQPITYYLYASLLEASGAIPSSIKALKAALFIDPNFTMAHYLLGVLEEQQGNPEESIRHIQIASKLMEKEPIVGILPEIEEFSSEHLRTLMRGHLKEL